MEQFHFTGRAEILHLNTRKEGPDDDKVLAAVAAETRRKVRRIKEAA